MGKNVNTYGVSFVWTDTPNTIRTGNFNLNRNVNYFLLKKIVISNVFHLQDVPPAAAIPVNEYALNDVKMTYILSNLGLAASLNTFVFGAAPAGVTITPNSFYFDKTGTYEFESLLITGQLDIKYNFTNSNLLYGVYCLSSFICEIEMI